jgi:bisphosphoglycerate-dependent phosphoglycerate mutase family 1
MLFFLDRHYGALQGLDKQATVNKYGKEQVLVWRRSYDIPPPACETGSPMLPANDPKYAAFPEAQKITTESLKVCAYSDLLHPALNSLFPLFCTDYIRSCLTLLALYHRP